MWVSYTLASFRDAIRRKVNITPPIDRLLDFPNAVAGQEPPWQRSPTNPLLNDLIRAAGAEVNRRAKNTETTQPISVTVTAQTANGPYAMPLNNTTAAFAQVNQPEHVWYVVSGDTISHPLEWRTAHAMNSECPAWMDEAPGIPRRCWMTGTTLQIWPAPSSAGAILFTAKIGVFAANSDGDTVAQLPADYLPCLIDIVVADLVEIQPNDEVFGARLQTSMAKKERAIGDIVDWMNTRNGNFVTGLRYRPGTLRRGRTR